MAEQPGLAAAAQNAEVEEIITSVRDIRYTQLVSFVVATIVVYDYVVCFEREVELIWRKKWSVIKLAFLWHRYLGVFCALFQAYALNAPRIDDEHQFCAFWFYWETWGYCAVLFTSEAVLLLWIYVVYNKNRWILAIISIRYVAEVVGVVTILTFSFQSFQAHSFIASGVQFCYMANIGKPIHLLWVPILGYDALLLLLFIYRGCAGSIWKRGTRWSYSYDSLLDTIYKHSLLNFLAYGPLYSLRMESDPNTPFLRIFVSYLACAIIWLTCSFGLYQIPVSFALALSITNCTRLLLNIRRAYYSGSPDPDPVLYNVRRDAGKRTPPLPLPALAYPALDCDRDVPMSPVSASSGLSQLSGSTLRETTPGSPASTVRVIPGWGYGYSSGSGSDRGPSADSVRQHAYSSRSRSGSAGANATANASTSVFSLTTTATIQNTAPPLVARAPAPPDADPSFASPFTEEYARARTAYLARLDPEWWDANQEEDGSRTSSRTREPGEVRAAFGARSPSVVQFVEPGPGSRISFGMAV
ncbi:hypothetical protein C8Q80DRAFT_1272114 [Daedaleopsis nitida]|nr:hypothetical protein C8Q80DRAFT_1272114 [Daedaleopsis nitida]